MFFFPSHFINNLPKTRFIFTASTSWPSLFKEVVLNQGVLENLLEFFHAQVPHTEILTWWVCTGGKGTKHKYAGENNSLTESTAHPRLRTITSNTCHMFFLVIIMIIFHQLRSIIKSTLCIWHTWKTNKKAPGHQIQLCSLSFILSKLYKIFDTTSF